MVPLSINSIKTGLSIGWKQLVKMAPTLGVIFGVGLMGAAAVKTGIETPKMRDALEELENEEDDISHKEYLQSKLRIYAYHLGWPAVMLVSGAVMIFSGYRIKYTQAAIATAALASKTEEAEKLEKKIVEKYGPREYEKMKDEITKDDVMKHPINYSTIINTGHGNMLCWDPLIHDYYWSDLEFIRQTARDLNDDMSDTRFRLLSNSAVNYNTWRRNLDLPDANEHPNLDKKATDVDIGKDLGWFNRSIGLKITAVLLPDDTVVHVIGFTEDGAPKWRLNLEDEDRSDFDYDESDGHQRYSHLNRYN